MLSQKLSGARIRGPNAFCLQLSLLSKYLTVAPLGADSPFGRHNNEDKCCKSLLAIHAHGLSPGGDGVSGFEAKPATDLYTISSCIVLHTSLGPLQIVEREAGTEKDS